MSENITPSGAEWVPVICDQCNGDMCRNCGYTGELTVLYTCEVTA